MKRITAVLLSLALVFSLTASALAADGENTAELKIAVASDLHYNQPEEELEWLTDDPVYGYASRRAAMENESGFIIDSFLEDCEDNGCDYVLISGDLADNGRRLIEEHEDVAAKLAAFEEKTGKQVFVIDGNHDLGAGDSATDIAAFKHIYADFGYDRALEVMEDNCSYTADLGDKYRLIALDSCDPTVSTEDGMTRDKVSWACAQADKAYEQGRYPILMMHHNLLDHMPAQRILSHDFIIRNHQMTAAEFASHGIRIVLTGHEHCSDAAKYISARGDVIYDFATTSLTMYPLAYRLFTFGDDEINYESKNIEKIDTAALSGAVYGYTDEQLALMDEDLTAYSKSFLKAGIRYRLSLSLSMEKIGIEESSPFYGLVSTAVGGLTGILEMPLYGENSAQSLAAEYGIDLPETDYADGWDLATELVGYHYSGEEPFDMDSDEVTLLLKLVALILQDDLANVNDSVFLSAANKLTGGRGISVPLTKAASRIYGGVTAGEYFLLAVASPILEGFGCDTDGVNDNNGTLPGYGAELSRTETAREKAGEGAKEILRNIYLFLRYILRIFRVII